MARFSPAKEPAADIDQEEPDRPGLKDENGPFLDRADREGEEDEKGTEPPENDMVDQIMPRGGKRGSNPLEVSPYRR
jgi:hypothetical protein